MKNSKKSQTTNKVEKIDLSQINLPENNNLTNKLLLNTIVDMVEKNYISNPTFPFVGVNEIANFLNENNNFSLTGKEVRRKLQKIRKSNKEYKFGKQGKIILDKNNQKNSFDENLIIQWANLGNREKGIFYFISPESKIK